MPEPRFKAGDIVRPKDAAYPTHCREIVEVTEDAYRFAPLGGGLVFRAPHDGLKDYVKVPDAEKVSPPWKPGRFCIDGGRAYEGISQDRRWNGWCMPAFTRETAFAICMDFGLHFTFYSLAGILITNEGGENPDEDSYDFFEVDGVTYCPLGAGVWCWEIADSDDTEERED